MMSGFWLDWILCVLYCGLVKALWKKWSLPQGVERKMAVPFVVESMGKIISVIVCSGMKAASSQIVRFAVYPRSRCSLQGRAMIWEWLVSWIIVLVLRVMLFVSVWFVAVWVRILSNIIMLCLSDGLMISVVVFGCV